jgi:hypothetical protein
MLLAVVVAACALSAVAVSTAAASETLSFVPQSGKFPVKKVTVKGSEVSFTEEETTYTCSSTAGEGEITAAKTAKLKFAFKECRPNGPGSECKSTGAKLAEIVTGTLPVELVYTNKAKHEAALDLNYTAPTEKGRKTLASWSCSPPETTGLGIRGSILAPVTPVNTATLTHKLTLKGGKLGVEYQEPRKYETETGEKFEAFPELNLLGFWSEDGNVTTGLELTTTSTEGTVEIKA